MRRRALVAGWMLTAGGCLSESEPLTRVSMNPFTTQPYPTASTPHLTMSPGTQAASGRVLSVGFKLIEANRSLGLRPSFTTIGGSAKEELFHTGTQIVFITEALVNRCQTDAQLAAVLSREIGRMIVEREAKADPATRRNERRPLADVPVGTDYGGAFGSPDGTRRMELGKLEKERLKGEGPAPDPEAIARECLRRAGYEPAEFDAAASLLQTAEANVTLERQLTGK